MERKEGVIIPLLPQPGRVVGRRDNNSRSRPWFLLALDDGPERKLKELS